MSRVAGKAEPELNWNWNWSSSVAGELGRELAPTRCSANVCERRRWSWQPSRRLCARWHAVAASATVLLFSCCCCCCQCYCQRYCFARFHFHFGRFHLKRRRRCYGRLARRPIGQPASPTRTSDVKAVARCAQQASELRRSPGSDRRPASDCLACHSSRPADRPAGQMSFGRPGSRPAAAEPWGALGGAGAKTLAKRAPARQFGAPGQFANTLFSLAN